MNYALPADYIELLKLHDGLTWKGLEIFGSETEFNAETKDATLPGLIYENAGYRMDDDNWQDYIVFGDADISWFVYSNKDKRYEVRDRGSFSFIGSFDSFEQMITEAFQVAA